MNNQNLIKTLSDAGMIAASPVSASDSQQTGIEEELAKNELESPWYIRLIQAFSGWFAAWFIIGIFASLFNKLFTEPLIASTLSIALIAGAYFLFRKDNNPFTEGLGLAFSLSGQLLLYIAGSKYFNYRQEDTLLLIFGIIQIPLIVLMHNNLHRLLSAFAAALCFAGAIYMHTQNINLTGLYSAALMFISAFLWLREFHTGQYIKRVQAVAYGLILALLVLNVSRVFNDFYLYQTSRALYSWIPDWLDQALFGLVTLYVVWQILSKHQRYNSMAPTNLTRGLALGGVVLLTILSQQAHGLIVGIMVLLLGFSASNRILIGLGISALLFFISHYYYALHTSLLDKSITLGLLGLSLLFAYWLMGKIYTNTSEKEDQL